MNACKICSNTVVLAFTTVVRRKYSVDFFTCTACGYLQADEPLWLGEAYQNSINIMDTGLLARNIDNARLSSILFYLFFDRKGTYLDYAGGYGVFTRLMRDIGFDFYSTDPHTKNLLAPGFEYNPSIGPIEAVTSFECFEHLYDPIKEVEKMVRISRNILFSTYLVPYPVPRPGAWWYYQFEHGQHISFYTHRSLERLGEHFGLRFYSFGSLHLLTEKKIHPRLMKVVFRFLGTLLFLIVRRNMESRTNADFERMKDLEVS